MALLSLPTPAEPRLRLVAPGKGEGASARAREPAAPMTDDDLLAAFLAGRPGAGARLYDRLFPVVDATLVRILGRRETDHADLVQSAFEQIVSTVARRTFGGRCGLAGWAAVLACHVGLNALRARRRERGVIDRSQALGDPPPVERARPAPFEAQLRARDELEGVRRHLAQMDSDRVTALLLHAMGHDVAEIAELTGTSESAAQSRLSRGRRELRSRLEAESGAQDPGGAR